MGLAVALVADDLTGALDAAAPFAGRGLRVSVHRSADTVPAPTGPAGEPPGPAAERSPASACPPPAPSPSELEPRPSGAVLAVSTSSRHLAPDAARASVRAAGRRLHAWSPRLVFKKIDSTLRGPVPDEVAAAMEVFERRAALVCPAFPAAGRVVRDGEVFVYGKPLRATEYARDLRTPSPTESLGALFARLGAVRHVRPDGGGLPQGFLSGIAIADAETETHLSCLAALVSSRARETLAVGSDGLATGLAGLFGRAGPPVRLAGGEGRVLLFALGSRTRTTAEQDERLRQANPEAAVVEAPAGILDAGAVARAANSARVVVARVPPDPRGDPGTVAREFAAGLRSAVEGLGGPACLAALIATGGDTLDAILDAFDVAALEVLGEFRPGIPVSRAAEGRVELVLVSKAGGFGTPDLFAELAAETVAS